MLKRIGLLSGLLLVGATVFSRETDPWETYLNRVYGSPYMQTLQIGDKSGTMTGCRFGWLATPRIRLGFVTVGVMPFVPFDSGIPGTGGNNLSYFFSYMGLEAEYVLSRADSLWFYSVNAHTGSGVAGVTDDLTDVGAIQYGFDIGVNLGKHTSICLGIANRSVSNFSNARLNAEQISGLTYSLIFKFGNFGKWEDGLGKQ